MANARVLGVGVENAKTYRKMDMHSTTALGFTCFDNIFRWLGDVLSLPP